MYYSPQCHQTLFIFPHITLINSLVNGQDAQTILFLSTQILLPLCLIRLSHRNGWFSWNWLVVTPYEIMRILTTSLSSLKRFFHLKSAVIQNLMFLRENLNSYFHIFHFFIVHSMYSLVISKNVVCLALSSRKFSIVSQR